MSRLVLPAQCNEPVGSRWCAKCPKCLFVVLLLSAFMEPCQVCSAMPDMSGHLPCALHPKHWRHWLRTWGHA
jgi:hypothetical protein